MAGSMIGSGVYLLPASLGQVGSIAILAWGAAIVAAFVFAGVFVRLVALPGGKRGFIASITDAFGTRTGFVAAALYWLQGMLGNVALALAVTGYLQAVVPVLRHGAAATACTVAVIWTFTALNLAGPRLVARLEGWTLVLGLVPVLAIATVGWFWFDPAIFAASWNVSGQDGHATLVPTTVLILWAFLGLESACLAAGVVRDPARTLPIATLGGVLLAAAIYLSACTALTGILPAVALAGSSAPFADAAARMGTPVLGAIVAWCAALKASGTLGGWVLLTTESGRLALAREARPSGSMARHLVAGGVMLTLVIVAIADPSIGRQFTIAINAAVVVMLCVYALAGAALVRLGARWDGALGLAGMAIVAAALASQERAMLLLALFAGVAALLLWWVRERRIS
ncbi:amino acid permease [Sphingomonas adhaesiva]|uniref:amino acid permease n=1 Tax=Sphingomonas adhaesiva TaxID=28212 RepID=UPI002FF9681E